MGVLIFFIFFFQSAFNNLGRKWEKNIGEREQKNFWGFSIAYYRKGFHIKLFGFLLELINFSADTMEANQFSKLPILYSMISENPNISKGKCKLLCVNWLLGVQFYLMYCWHLMAFIISPYFYLWIEYTHLFLA